MPSLFSRTSTPKKKPQPQPQESLDEFGRISSTQLAVADGSFLPLDLSGARTVGHEYGYLGWHRDVVLGLEQVSRLVTVVCGELGTRGGVTTPFIFSTTALDISTSGIRRLIEGFLGTCRGDSTGDAERRWRDEAGFAGPHELGMCLRWGLGRAVRWVGGEAVRGLLSWEAYGEFRESETAQGFPPGHFAALLQNLSPTLQTVLITLLTLLSRLTAHSTRSGHTPPTLSPLFGPLVFGLGPAALAFHQTYAHYLRAVHAMEHLQLVFIRWQDATSAPSLPIPVRLAEWIRRYPAVLHKPPTQPRPAARTVRILAVRRNVRIYSPDLVKSAASWASPKNALSNEWARIAPLKLPPRYSDAYRKRMAMPSNFHPDTGSLAPPPLAAASSSDSLCAPRSLTDLKWGEFESMGFATLDDAKKLQFDLTESARTERSAKRESLNWADFSSTGFSRGDAPLSATLQFSTPVANTISSWPAHHAEIDKKVKNTEKALPPFGWDTEPVIVNEEIIEEAFVDVFCDLLYGGGWMDLESSERECNWALVEFKSLPPKRSTVSGDADPRTSTSLILFEEFVPLEYRQQLAIPPSARRRRLPSLFTNSLKSPSTKSKSKSKSKSSSMTTYTNTKGWKQAPTLNGRPYVVGHVPRSPTSREVEFEEILRRDAGTKVIRLGARESVPPSVQMEAEPEEEPEPERKRRISGPLYVEKPVETERAPAPAPKSDSAHSQSESESAGSGSAKRSRGLFRLPVNVPVSVNVTGGGGGGGVSPARRRVGAAGEWEFEFEFGTGRGEGRGEGDEAWVDILVGRRGGGVELGKDLELDKDKDKDPDVVSREVERVLAGVRDQTRERERAVSIGSRVDRDSEGGLDRFYVERVSEESRYTDEREEQHEEAQQEQQTQQPRRRMGYFDLHPERRIVGRGCEDEEGEGEEEGKERGLGGRAVVRKLPVPPAHAPPSPVPVIKIEPYTVDPQSQSQSQKHAPAKQPASPNGHGHGHGNGHAQPAPAAAPISKTAALIEMYRERERASSLKSGSVSMAAPMTAPMTAQVPTQVPTTPTTPTQVQVQVPTTPTQMPMPTTPTQTQPQASQLPARSSSLMKEGGGGVVPLAAPVPKVAVQALVGPGPLEPPRVGGEGTGTGTAGRASPGRYVHGAPLHNVLEEEEEE